MSTEPISRRTSPFNLNHPSSYYPHVLHPHNPHTSPCLARVPPVRLLAQLVLLRPPAVLVLTILRRYALVVARCGTQL